MNILLIDNEEYYFENITFKLPHSNKSYENKRIIYILIYNIKKIIVYLIDNMIINKYIDKFIDYLVQYNSIYIDRFYDKYNDKFDKNFFLSNLYEVKYFYAKYKKEFYRNNVINLLGIVGTYLINNNLIDDNLYFEKFYLNHKINQNEILFHLYLNYPEYIEEYINKFVNKNRLKKYFRIILRSINKFNLNRIDIQYKLMKKYTNINLFQYIFDNQLKNNTTILLNNYDVIYKKINNNQAKILYNNKLKNIKYYENEHKIYNDKIWTIKRLFLIGIKDKNNLLYLLDRDIINYIFNHHYHHFYHHNIVIKLI